MSINQKIAEFWKDMNKKWLILAAMVIFDGFSVHYPAIFFGAPIVEPNPLTRYIITLLGAKSVFLLIPLAILIIWSIVKLAAKYTVKHEKRYKTLEEAESGLLNYVLVAYSVIIIGEILMLANRFFEFPAKLLPFYYKNRWLNEISGTTTNYLLVITIIVLAVFIYSIYEKTKLRKSEVKKR